MGNLISTPEAAALLGVHRVTVHVWLQEGKLTAAGYIGGGARPRPVFDRAYIEALAAKRKHIDPQPAASAA